MQLSRTGGSFAFTLAAAFAFLVPMSVLYFGLVAAGRPSRLISSCWLCSASSSLRRLPTEMKPGHNRSWQPLCYVRGVLVAAAWLWHYPWPLWLDYSGASGAEQSWPARASRLRLDTLAFLLCLLKPWTGAP